MTATIRVLLVDDDLEDQLLTRELLEDIRFQSFALDCVSTYDDALAAIDRQEHDVLLFDHYLGSKTGLDLLNASQERGCRVPIIMLTGTSDRDTDLGAMQGGAADYLCKAKIDGPMLERSIRYAIERARSLETLNETARELETANQQLRTNQVQLAQAEKLKSIGQLAAGVAHEINTPIQFVAENTRFLEGAFRDIGGVLQSHAKLIEAARSGCVPPESIESVDRADQAADLDYLTEEIPVAIAQTLDGVERVATIVRAMRSFSHPDNAEQVDSDLNEIIRTTITMSRSEWKHIAKVETDLDSSLPLVPCFPSELNQVFVNLIVNSTHAILEARQSGQSDELGTITVRTEQDDDCAVVTVSDTGRGIPNEIQTRIFDLFFTTKPVGIGTGQGLALAYGVIVEKHGGSISVDSPRGKGATFPIRLPLEGRQSSGSRQWETCREEAAVIC